MFNELLQGLGYNLVDELITSEISVDPPSPRAT